MTIGGDFEVYKGWIIKSGITMPAQGIHDFNVYLTREEIQEDKPRYTASSLEDARKWIDEQEPVSGDIESLVEVAKKMPFMPEKGEPLPEYVARELYPSTTLELMEVPVSDYGRVVADETARLLKEFMQGGNFELKSKFEEGGWSSEDIIYMGDLIHVPTKNQYLVEIYVSFEWRDPTKVNARLVSLFREKPEGPEEVWGGDLNLENGKEADKALRGLLGLTGRTSSTPWNPAESYFHGTYSAESIAGIISEGLTVGSSVSSWKGQATAYPIILEYADLAVERVYYRPEDFNLLKTSGRPVAIYVDIAEFGAGVRAVDEINEELARILERLENQGIATPERVSDLIVDKDYRTLKELDERLPHIAKEMDAFIDRGPSPGGEDIFKRVVEQADSIPVYRIDRDDEGEINWSTRRR